MGVVGAKGTGANLEGVFNVVLVVNLGTTGVNNLGTCWTFGAETKETFATPETLLLVFVISFAVCCNPATEVVVNFGCSTTTLLEVEVWNNFVDGLISWETNDGELTLTGAIVLPVKEVFNPASATGELSNLVLVIVDKDCPVVSNVEGVVGARLIIPNVLIGDTPVILSIPNSLSKVLSL